jgi:hypothetical protein
MTLTNPTQSGVPELLIAAALERYQARWNEVIATCFDRDHCRAVNAELDNIRGLVTALPPLWEDMAEVVMRHAQLLLVVARPTSAQPKAAGVAALRKKHSLAIEGIRDRCLQAVQASQGS